MLNSVSSHDPYTQEALACVEPYRAVLLDELAIAGVAWKLTDGIEAGMQIIQGMGYHMLLHETAAIVPLFRGRNCSTDDATWRDQCAAEKKRDSIVSTMRPLFEEMDASMPITSVVEGLTGTPPRWSNVTRVLVARVVLLK